MWLFFFKPWERCRSLRYGIWMMFDAQWRWNGYLRKEKVTVPLIEDWQITHTDRPSLSAMLHVSSRGRCCPIHQPPAFCVKQTVQNPPEVVYKVLFAVHWDQLTLLHVCINVNWLNYCFSYLFWIMFSFFLLLLLLHCLVKKQRPVSEARWG